ncbi:TIGR04283 family arsenosugar biosynthesis glycosyltransferase [Prosthecobacter sp.]|uniref:TIGR04283 family arsenosugar biosynthesis glycosyltransferase n=1 Tax=Prosthecobacter sp. TaxID=1965333 RepID=UPI002AB7F44A|nr:TIGR04283 family arsenosugar biosynthesis glycosyltransferase [Prosthecobacter sp.]MDZ4405345.1 TIGR04283 family arsenosugar biosynthesis glycosyltransferase [Prosthecobacter sp.]
MPYDALIVFTRLPQPGKAKTRLIPMLGAEGAADLQRRMTLQTVGRAWAACAASGTRLIIAHEGGTGSEMCDWIGPLCFHEQTQGDLGARLTHAMMMAHAQGAQKIVIIGTDCPDLTEEHLSAAFAMLDESDVVLGPAHDGGYYLIGMREPQPSLFEAIPWSTAEVFAVTQQRASEAGLSLSSLPTLADVDEPADVAHAETALANGCSVTVIIPALNEAAALQTLLPAVQAGKPLQIIVTDGGSTDDTAAVAAQHGAEIIHAPRGRARQMNETAKHAHGEYLLFLHADTLPPVNFAEIIFRHLTPGVAAGAFRFALREKIVLQGMIEGFTRLRGKVFAMPYGDQGLFLRRRLFHAIGGFPDWPILEDVEMIKRLRHLGQFVITPEAAATSARRWQQSGVLRTWARHQLILAGHALGVSPQRLAKLR